MSKNKFALIGAGIFMVILISLSGSKSEDRPVQVNLVTATSTKTEDTLARETEVVKSIVPVKPQAISDNQSYRVIKVVDGDTIQVSINGINETLRLIGINTPETVDPRKPVECFGKEASNKAKELLTGKTVTLEADPSQGERDKYSRLLRYVYLPDGTSFNKLMIEDGYAYEYTYNTPYKYQKEFKQAEVEARDTKRGLWSPATCNGQNTAQTSAPQAQTTQDTTPNPGNYICSYNAYNCSDFKTQAEAQSAFDVCGGPSSDIHKLDQDKDGRVCENLP